MTTLTLDLASGRKIDFEVELGLTGPAYFAFGVRRSGSSLFTNLVKALSLANHKNIVDWGPVFDNDVRAAEWHTDPAVNALVRPGNVYCGFRDMPLSMFDNEVFLSSPRLFLVRDPRDTLVSLYFAIAHSHPLPNSRAPGGLARSMENRRARARITRLDDYVVTAAAPLRRTLIEYSRLLDIPGTTLFRYEDVIFDKRRWLAEILAAFDWTAHDDEIRDILGFADVVPEKEDPAAFVRHVTPGDHREKLAPETLTTLNRMLAPVMEIYGYA